jgi:hypothetical protein
MHRYLPVALIGAALSLVLTSCAAVPVTAAEANDPACYTPEELEHDATATAGGKIVGAACYDGAQTDSMIFVQGRREILAFGFKDGCLIGMQSVDLTRPTGEPA